MEISPIREVRAIGAAIAPKAESEIQPLFAFNLVARMEDDQYRRNDRGPERGLEEEEPEMDEGADAAAADSDDPDCTVDVLA